jgi:hypothetical protein
LQNLRNGCIIRNWHNFYNQSKRNVRKIPDTANKSAPEKAMTAPADKEFGGFTEA